MSSDEESSCTSNNSESLSSLIKKNSSRSLSSIFEDYLGANLYFPYNISTEKVKKNIK
jgi:hypothetical protein